MTLTYDMTFLVILLTGLYEPDTKTEMVRCIAHPMQKHAAKTNEFTEYAAAINMLLSYYKCEDDWADEHRKKAFVVLANLTAAALLLLPQNFCIQR